MVTVSFFFKKTQTLQYRHLSVCAITTFSGGGWKLIAGLKEGQTQVDNPEYENVVYWCHPIDVHFATKGIQGKPLLYLINLIQTHL